MASAFMEGGRPMSTPAIDGFPGTAFIFFGGISWRALRVPDRFLFKMRFSIGSGLIARGLGSALIERGLDPVLIIGDRRKGQKGLTRI